MCGAYVGADEFRSRLAVLSERFASPTSGTTTAPQPKDRGVWSQDF